MHGHRSSCSGMFAGLLGYYHLERLSSIYLSWNTDLDLRGQPGPSVLFRDGIVAARLSEETRAVTIIAVNKTHAMTDLILPYWLIVNIFRGQLIDGMQELRKKVPQL
jgi:hypothetical protein